MEAEVSHSTILAPLLLSWNAFLYLALRDSTIPQYCLLHWSFLPSLLCLYPLPHLQPWRGQRHGFPSCLSVYTPEVNSVVSGLWWISNWSPVLTWHFQRHDSKTLKAKTWPKQKFYSPLPKEVCASPILAYLSKFAHIYSFITKNLVIFIYSSPYWFYSHFFYKNVLQTLLPYIFQIHPLLSISPPLPWFKSSSFLVWTTATIS